MFFILEIGRQRHTNQQSTDTTKTTDQSERTGKCGTLDEGKTP